ncbi:Pentatricopeptide repeat-containing protein -mitochondrial [Striga hermonthica]|uniref:Pentatricopeptide repeat-containing protein -mitochondrial n=1 Tax=Striga hermonthica TaxID=68872 RepID=A0A9N7N866_STRHE|nr:Pentatricopeptide repeat-containing protein -mitochondrial [Striga hermonthica]
MASIGQAFRSLIRTRTISTRLYFTTSKQNKKASLYARISPLGNPGVNVTLELDKWVESGNKVGFSELQRIVFDFRKRRRYTHALQVSEWMRNRDTFEFTTIHHAIQLDLIGVVHGITQAENYFNSLSEQFKNEKVYGALLHCYARKRQIEKAQSHLNTMIEKDIVLSSPAFNDIMGIYLNTSENEKVPGFLKQMKDSGIQPNNLSYRLCINSYGVRSDIEGMENILDEMESDSSIVMDWKTYAAVANFYIKASLTSKANVVLKKAEGRLGSKDGVAYNSLISLHARLGNKDDVLRLWCLEKKACKRYLNHDYTNMLESLVKLGEFDEAENVLSCWGSSGNQIDLRVPKVLVFGYTEKGLCEKAEMLLNHLVKTGKGTLPDMWGRVVEGYLEKGEVDNAVNTLKVARSVHDASDYSKLEKMISDYKERNK